MFEGVFDFTGNTLSLRFSGMTLVFIESKADNFPKMLILRGIASHKLFLLLVLLIYY